MLKASPKFIFTATVCLFCIAPVRAADTPIEIPDEPFDISAARLEFTNDTLYASGGVTGRFENAVIHADTISGNPKTGDLHISGDVLFERDNVIWRGTELDYNYLTESGIFGPSELKFDPVLMSVQHVERVSTNEYLLKGAEFTTCTNSHSHYHLSAKEARLVDEEFLIAKGVTVYAGKVPVAYLPYWRHRLNQKIFTFQFGFGSEWGAYIHTRATVPVSKDINSITDLNLYGKRGVGLGQGFTWETPNAVGEFAAFYIKDEDPFTKYDSATAKGLIDDDRYRLKLEHLQNFTDTHYVNTKLNYLSDPAVLEEFLKPEYRRNAQPENYLSWVYGTGTIGTEGFVNQRLNDFYSNTDRIEYSMDLYRSKLGNTPFYLQSENTVGYLDRVFSETNTPAIASFDSTRIDTANTLFLPYRMGFLNLVGRASYRATYYSETAAGNPDAEEIRQIPGAGLEVSFQATKIISERERWYGRGLRHKIEPYADYMIQDSNVSPADLLQFDDVDSLRDENKVQVGLRNVLQTRRNNRTSRFIDLDLYTYYMIEDHGTGNDFDSLYLDARMPLSTKTIVDMEGEYDWNKGKLPYFNTRLSHRHEDLILRFEHLYRDDEESLWTTGLELFPRSRWSLEGFVRYEDRSNDLEEIGAIVYANWCCMRYGLGYHVYDDNEQRIMLSIGLSAFPEAKMSSSL